MERKKFSRRKALLFAVWVDKKKNLKINKRKLKLGAISFEIFEYIVPGTPFVIFETVDIRFINQDNTEEDEQKLDTRSHNLRIKYFYFLTAVLSLILFLVFSYFCVFMFAFLIEVDNSWLSSQQVTECLFEPPYLKILKKKKPFYRINQTTNSLFIEFFSFFNENFR